MLMDAHGWDKVKAAWLHYKSMHSDLLTIARMREWKKAGG